MKKVDNFISRRKYIWDTYKEELQNLDWLILPPEPEENCTSSYFMFWMRVKNGWRDEFAQHMIDNGVYVTFRYYPLHLIEQYKQTSLSLPVSEEISDTTINIPIHQNLDDNDVDTIIDVIKNFRRHK